MLCWFSAGVVCFFRECIVYLFLEPFVERRVLLEEEKKNPK